jgi:hypothetical protein
MFLTEVSPLAVIIAALLNIVLGSLWYASFAFGRAWLQDLGRPTSDSDKYSNEGMGPTYGILALASLIITYILGVLIIRFEAMTFWQGAQLGFWLWLGLIAPVKLNDVLFGGRTQRMFLIDIGFYLTSIVLMGGLLAILR